MADSVEEEMAEEEYRHEEESSEMKQEMSSEETGAAGDNNTAAGGDNDDAGKTEEEIEEELKETRITIARYSPHTVPEFKFSEMKERWMWHLKIYPLDQEDCRNCILDAATKISQEAFYYVPKRKNGQGVAELSMISDNEANAVMSRVVRMPFYHRYVTLELTKRSREDGKEADEMNTEPVYTKIEETATIVFDSTKCEKIKNTATSRGNQKRRSLWVRYLSENTSPELLRVIFPLSQSTQVQTHDSLRIGLIEANSKTDVLVFMKAYVTVIINNTHILALQNKEPAENESEFKVELEKTVTPFSDLQGAPTEIADRSDQRKDDKNQTSRVLKRTLQQQQRLLDGRRRDQKRGGRGEPPAKRGTGNWGDSRFDRRSGGGRYGGGFGGGAAYSGRSGYGVQDLGLVVLEHHVMVEVVVEDMAEEVVEGARALEVIGKSPEDALPHHSSSCQLGTFNVLIVFIISSSHLSVF
ncbi:keratin, type I cytoskeletal 9 [Biomphalaria glabrata]|nr:keratin, type I cytoskeletal 9 [Biomphalaria glabrata]